MSEEAESRSWHQALAFALTARRQPELGLQRRPDPARLLAELVAGTPGGLDGLREQIERLRAGGPWPVAVPADLRRGLGAAQLAAALAELRRLITPIEPVQTTADRPLDSTEQALARDVPPHHLG